MNKQEILKNMIDGKIYETESQECKYYYDKNYNEPFRVLYYETEHNFNMVNFSIFDEFNFIEIKPWYEVCSWPKFCYCDEFTFPILIFKYDSHYGMFEDKDGATYKNVTPLTKSELMVYCN